uniref:Uncharacterized protein n=1 Tax=Glossina palpalis gambiensis TaxID=67801 RepID=A0A1B0BQP4_9MUSC
MYSPITSPASNKPETLLFILNNCNKPIESANTGEPQSLNPCHTNCRPGVKAIFLDFKLSPQACNNQAL